MVLVAVFAFWIRRNVIKVKRFTNSELKGYASKDANTILYFEVVLMSLFLIMNATDIHFQQAENGNAISQYIHLFSIHFLLQLLKL